MKLFVSVIMLSICNVIFAQVKCGDIITKNLTLTHDMKCTSGPHAIMIRASNVTLDLGGFTISGDRGRCIVVEKSNDVTIRNGSIEGFSNGIALDTTNNVLIEKMNIKSLKIIDPNDFVTGIVVNPYNGPRSIGIKVKDSYFELPKNISHKEAIIMANCDFIVDNIKVKHGSVGVNYGGQKPSNGSITNSKFFRTSGAGVLVQNSSNGWIENNAFFQNEVGVLSDPNSRNEVSGLTIKRNNFRGCIIGILFYGTTDSFILGNSIRHFHSIRNGHRGITLVPQKEYSATTGKIIDVFCSKKNEIRNNKVSGNIFDLFQHKKCTDNIWRKNEFTTWKQGHEIP